MFVHQVTVQQLLLRVPKPAPSVLVLVQHIAVHLLLMLQQALIVQPTTIAVTEMGTAQPQQVEMSVK